MSIQKERFLAMITATSEFSISVGKTKFSLLRMDFEHHIPDEEDEKNYFVERGFLIFNHVNRDLLSRLMGVFGAKSLAGIEGESCWFTREQKPDEEKTVEPYLMEPLNPKIGKPFHIGKYYAALKKPRKKIKK